jgi:hypothetical protein
MLISLAMGAQVEAVTEAGFRSGSALEKQPPPIGLYFGQMPPGAQAERYAPGILSTSEFEHGTPIFTSDGRAFYFCRVVGPPWRFENYRYQMDADGSWTRETIRPHPDALQAEFLPSRDG